jgi:hypothetical protein
LGGGLPLLVLFALTGCGQASTPAAGSQQSETRAPSVPTSVERSASRAGVSSLVRLGSPGPNGLGFFSGEDTEGTAVIGFGSDNQSSPFVSRDRFDASLAANHLYVFTADGGSALDRVDHREVLGQVSADVTRVVVKLENGETLELPLVDQVFVYASDTRATFPVAVVAQDAKGSSVASKTLSAASAPG